MMSESTQTENLKTNSYKIGLSNYNDFYFAYSKKNYFNRYKIFFTILYTLLAALTLSWFTDPVGLNVVKIVAFFITSGIVVYIIWPIFVYLLSIISYLVGPLPKNVNITEINSNEITRLENQKIVKFNWVCIFCVIETKNTILFFTSKKCAHIIPKSAFLSPELAIKFKLSADNYWREAQIKPE